MSDGQEPRFRIKPLQGEAPSLSETVKEGIRLLETETSISSQAKILILATVLRKKPSSEFNLASDDRDELSTKAERTEAILQRLGLSFTASESTDGSGRHFRDYCIALTQDRAEALQNIFRNTSYSPQQQIQVGRALGFPETAITAWNQKRFEGLDTLASEAEIWRDFGLELGEFLFFAPSKTFWQDEKKWLRDVVDQIKAISPTIYEQTLKT